LNKLILVNVVAGVKLIEVSLVSPNVKSVVDVQTLELDVNPAIVLPPVRAFNFQLPLVVDVAASQYTYPLILLTVVLLQ